MTGGSEGGNEYVPEPLPEATSESAPEAPAEAPPEPSASESASLDAPAQDSPAEPPPGDVRRDSTGADRDVLAEGMTDDGRLDTAKAEEAASGKLTDEMASRLAEAGAERSGETVATGSLSDDPEQAGAQLAAVRGHSEQRAAYLEQRAQDDKFEQAQRAKDMAADADEFEASRQEEREVTEAAAFRSKLDDGTGMGKFEYRPNEDGKMHVSYRSETLDKGMEDEMNAKVHTSWDEDSEGNRTNVHMTDHDAKEAWGAKPIDL